MNLTKRTIETLTCPPAKASAIFYCDEVGGLAVRVTAAGVKTWVLRYRTRTGTERLTKIGRCAVLTPDAARLEARRLLGIVASGGDPAGDLAAGKREAANPQTHARRLRGALARSKEKESDRYGRASQPRLTLTPPPQRAT